MILRERTTGRTIRVPMVEDDFQKDPNGSCNVQRALWTVMMNQHHPQIGMFCPVQCCQMICDVVRMFQFPVLTTARIKVVLSSSLKVPFCYPLCETVF